MPECCEGLKGWALAWHRYSAHGGPYPKKPRRFRRQTIGKSTGDSPE